MSYTITPFSYTDEAYERALRLRNRLQPDEPSSVEIWRYWDKIRTSNTLFQRLVASDGAGQYVAYATIEETSPTREAFTLSIDGLPTIWQTDLPQMLYQRLLEKVRPYEKSRLFTNAREDEQQKCAFLHRNGFTMVMRSPVSYLDLIAFNTARFESSIERIQQSGIHLCQPPRDWQHDVRWQERIFDLYWTLLQEMPQYETCAKPLSKPPLSRFIEAEIQHPNFLPDGYFLAVDHNQLVGISSLVMRGGQAVILGTGLTGVLQTHRRRGLATALKVQAIRYAQSLNSTRIVTDNEENNPMYLLNQRLGFVPQPAQTHWEKRTKGEI